MAVAAASTLARTHAGAWDGGGPFSLARSLLYNLGGSDGCGQPGLSWCGYLTEPACGGWIWRAGRAWRRRVARSGGDQDGGGGVGRGAGFRV